MRPATRVEVFLKKTKIKQNTIVYAALRLSVASYFFLFFFNEILGSSALDPNPAVSLKKTKNKKTQNTKKNAKIKPETHRPLFATSLLIGHMRNKSGKDAPEKGKTAENLNKKKIKFRTSLPAAKTTS